MLLALDIGNSHIKYGLWDGRSWATLGHWQTLTGRTADDYGLQLLALHAAPTAVTQVVLASVVPALTTIISGACGSYLGHDPLVISATQSGGVRVLTDAPEQVGPDRIANAIAVHHAFAGPCLVLDLGTATTIDAVSAAGELLGGVIAPGLALSANCLTNRAARLQPVPLEAPPAALGKNTTHAVQSGLVFGYVAFLEGMVARLRAELEWPAANVIATGGLAPVVAPHTGCFDAHLPTLTLDGLRLAAQVAA